MANKPRFEIFDGATVQCLHCGRFFIKPIGHRCNTGNRKRHFKWLKVSNLIDFQI